MIVTVCLVRKLKLSKEGCAGSQMACSIRWPSGSHFPLRLISSGADLFEAGLPLARPQAPRLGVVCTSFDSHALSRSLPKMSDVPLMVREENCQVFKNSLKADGQRSAGGQCLCVSPLLHVTHFRHNLHSGRKFGVKEMLHPVSGVCRFEPPTGLNLLVLYQIPNSYPFGMFHEKLKGWRGLYHGT